MENQERRPEVDEFVLEPLDDDDDSYDGDDDEYCFTCNNLGRIECECGGDLCICTEGPEIPCPDCDRGVDFSMKNQDRRQFILTPRQQGIGAGFFGMMAIVNLYLWAKWGGGLGIANAAFCLFFALVYGTE